MVPGVFVLVGFIFVVVAKSLRRDVSLVVVVVLVVG